MCIARQLILGRGFCTVNLGPHHRYEARTERGIHKAVYRKAEIFAGFRSYNVVMPAAGPKREPERKPLDHHPIPEVYTLETTGLLVIAVLILFLTLIRYWHHIPWSAR
jgi:hypothetical protein